MPLYYKDISGFCFVQSQKNHHNLQKLINRSFTEGNLEKEKGTVIQDISLFYCRRGFFQLSVFTDSGTKRATLCPFSHRRQNQRLSSRNTRKKPVVNALHSGISGCVSKAQSLKSPIRQSLFGKTISDSADRTALSDRFLHL